jgi:hypothetical protein
VSRPADWAPLATADPVPGDPVEVAQLGRRLRQVADQISADVGWLRSLCTARFWDDGAGQAFQAQVEDAAAKLARARERYLAAAEALGGGLGGPGLGYAGALEAAQALSLRALAQAQRAWAAMRAQLAAIEVATRGSVPYAGPPSLTLFPGLPRLDISGNPVPMVTPASADPQLSAAVCGYNASALEYRAANGWLAEAVAAREEAAARAAAQIQAAIGADGLQDQRGRWHDVTPADEGAGPADWNREHA